ncbi:MAG TPA: aldehyde dehydrogenase family protein [Polyangiaceae bacterium]|nr:aldehyde dehydrogenase family protein [Polyangiaceae bacterium]
MRDNAQRFARTPIAQKIAWLREIAARSVEVAEEQVAAGCRAKGIPQDSPVAGEEWLGGPAVTLRNLRLLRESLAQIAERGTPTVDSSAIIERPGGLAVRAIPHDGFDKALFAPFSCDTWIGSSVERARIADSQASFYKLSDPTGGVSLVLGAGNVASIPPMDVLYKMFVEGNVCILKMNPVNEYLGPFIERAFAPLIQGGYLAVVYGGAEVGSFLSHHEYVDDIHITGSDITHDIIVWGPPGPEREDRKRRKDPLLKKRITSELGNVSPVMIVPGPYSDSEIQFMAQNVAGMVANNASFNCNAAKLLVLPKGWSGRAQFLRDIGEALSRVPPRKAYYPGAQDRYQSLTAGKAEVRKFGHVKDGDLPWTLVTGLDSDDSAERNFYTEPFCSILSETQVGSDDPAEFLATATAFANDRVWGTLNATLFVHPRTEGDPKLQPALDRAIAELRYGSIGINHWPALVYGFGAPPWGGHPSATLENIQSGLGWVHNTLMLEDIEKSVLRGPLKVFPKPAWFPGHKTLHRLGRALMHFELEPSWKKIPALALMAVRA